jgi:hypothetical protein
MNNFAKSLPNEGKINNKAEAFKNSQPSSNVHAFNSKALNVSIVEQHKKWSKTLKIRQQANKRRSSPTLTHRLAEMSNLKLAILGSLGTAAAIALFISVLVILGY